MRFKYKTVFRNFRKRLIKTVPVGVGGGDGGGGGRGVEDRGAPGQHECQ